ncbi:hypothetical protein HNO52_11560 [Billgrantia diversa]|uniref:hypothetical protein n=1 Tax=Halomonas sp. MCCC 1A13316 TaxID=2733487 RepID=UPI0018A5E0B4|nr:hypothetical protein [Halomonas sp. MCCC 1A13316]QOR39080.1 hypothetical protein HNO52_11560 [Halomonas sp. MCCC 1A13316]
MPIKLSIKELLFKLPFFYQRCFIISVLLFESLIQYLRCCYLRFSGMHEFNISSLRNDRLPRRCHILGSGWSLNHSFCTINTEKEFVIGFNFSYLKFNSPDLHFVENASYKNHVFSDNTALIYYGLRRHSVFENSIVVFKNLSEIKNNVKLISSLYSKKSLFIKDKHYRILSNESLEYCVDKMMEDHGYVPQAYSSAIGLIFFAYHMGFEEIIIHGLDFGGAHFYGEDLVSAIALGCSDRTENQHGEEKYKPHKTSLRFGEVGIQEMLALIKEKFEKKSVKLYSTPFSPSAEILGYVDDAKFSADS